MMGAISGAGGHYIDKYQNTLGKAGEISANAVLGGTIDELGGGKFANGAITSAFSIMFNDMMHPQNGDEIKKVNINKDKDQYSGLVEFAEISTVAGTALLADDMTGVGIADDPIAVACFVAAGVAETAIIVVTTADALKKLYHVYMAEHTKNPTPSNRDKHTKRRAGKTYGKVKNQNRGDKNKKYEHPVNPNKKRK